MIIVLNGTFKNLVKTLQLIMGIMQCKTKLTDKKGKKRLRA